MCCRKEYLETAYRIIGPEPEKIISPFAHNNLFLPKNSVFHVASLLSFVIPRQKAGQERAAH